MGPLSAYRVIEWRAERRFLTRNQGGTGGKPEILPEGALNLENLDGLVWTSKGKFPTTWIEGKINSVDPVSLNN